MKKDINPFHLSVSGNLILVAAVVIIGAVFAKSAPEAGYWITLAGLGWYLIVNAVSFVGMLRRFSSLPSREKAHVLIVAVLFLLLLRALIFSRDLPYFMMLVLLAVDYLLQEPAKSE